MDITQRNEILAKGQEYCDLGVENARRGAHTTALTYFDHAESRFQEVNDRHWLTFLQHERLQSLCALEQHEEALKLSESVINGYLETKNQKGLALVWVHTSNIHLYLRKLDDALISLRVAQTIAQKENLSDTYPYIYSNLATVFIELEDYNQAIHCLEVALKHYRKGELIQEEAWCLHQLGTSFQKIFLYHQAEESLESAYQKYLKIGGYEVSNMIMEQ
ncbi:MAG: tetratricopeptide (TPR) repeat protein, partial [bacterium]